MDVEKEKSQKKQALKRGEVIHKTIKTAIFNSNGEAIMTAGQLDWRFKNPIVMNDDDEDEGGGTIHVAGN